MEDANIYELVEIARQTGKIKKGINEVTKAIERGIAKLVIAAKDVDPKEIIMHLNPLCEEKKIPYIEVGSKESLGRSAGIKVSCSAVAIIDFGQGEKTAEKIIKSISETNE